MSPQQLHLSWKDHNGALVVVFENLLKRNTLVDCTLAAEGQYLKAHKVVLSACSSYFELLFSQESEKNPIVILKDVKFQELEAAVNFMYRGEVEVCEDRLAAFLEVADSLQIKGLGSEGRAKDLKGESPSLKSPNVVPPKSHSRKEVSLNQSDNTGETSIVLDSDKNSNESSSHHQLLHRETSGSSPFPSSATIASSYSIVSTSTSIPIKTERQQDGELLENYQCPSSSVTAFPLGDSVPSDVNTLIKTESVTDAYLGEKSDEGERDFDEVTKMEFQEDWDDPNIESMGDDQTTNPNDPEATWEHGSAGSGEGPHFAGVFFKEQRPGVDPGTAPAPGPAPDSGPGTSSASSRQGGARTGTAGRGTATLAPRAGHFQCSQCDYATKYSSHWARHQFVHTAARPFKCTICRFATVQESKLRVHMRMHSGEKPFSCAICSYATTQSTNLKLHMYKHTGGKPYKCTICPFATAVKSKLTVHMRKHTGEKPFRCTVCTYATTQSSNLKLHMQRHTGEMPHKCTVCSFATTKSDNLKLHMRVHTGEKPFKCTVCSYATTQSHSLKSHMRIHTGEKHFKCTVCSYATTQSCNLKSHMKKHN